jgi:hypothetical protein
MWIEDQPCLIDFSAPPNKTESDYMHNIPKNIKQWCAFGHNSDESHAIHAYLTQNFHIFNFYT